MIFTKLEIEGAYLIEPERREDERGYFARLWCEKTLRERGLDPVISQINAGFSPRAGTLRGLHFQIEPHAEVKLARCVRGAAYDVVVDLRPQSCSFLRWLGVDLSADNGRSVYVPEGCAHGYLTCEPNTELIYLTSRPYSPESARGVRFNDPRLAIRWPFEPSVISQADRSWPDIVS